MRPEPGFRPQHGHAQQLSRVEPKLLRWRPVSAGRDRPDRQVREHDSNEQCLLSKSLLPMASELSEYLDHVARARSEYGRYINAFAVRGRVEQLRRAQEAEGPRNRQG